MADYLASIFGTEKDKCVEFTICTLISGCAPDNNFCMNENIAPL